MRISRLYLSGPLSTGDILRLDEDNAHYLRTVLRLKKTNSVTIFNGQGGEYTTELIEVSRKQVLVKIGDWQDCQVESPLNICMGLAVSRADRMDLAVQKTVELGVNRIEPLLTDRSVVQFKKDKKQQKMRHWQNIVQHAAEQSGRTILPTVTEPTELYTWVINQQGLKIFLDPFADTNLTQLRPEQKLVTLLSGPEGGFTDQERKIAIHAGFLPVKLGCRILRTETAALAAVAAIQTLWGDLGNDD